VSRSDFFVLPKLEGHNHTIAHGINDAGTIVGEAFSFYFDGKPSRQPEAVIWPTQNEIETLPVPASTILSQAFSVNDNGWIIGVVALDEPSQASERVVVWRGDLEQRLEFLPLSQIGPGVPNQHEQHDRRDHRNACHNSWRAPVDLENGRSGAHAIASSRRHPVRVESLAQ
jgi:hypothetical protein